MSSDKNDVDGSRAGPAGSARKGRTPKAAVLEAMEQDLNDRNERYLRLAADFENYKRRTGQEFLDRGRYASEEAARELLPVLDNLRRATEQPKADGGDDKLRDGLMLVIREFESALERIGVVPIDSVGAAFDPSVHDAIGGEESEDVEHDTVIAELQRGFRLHDRVLRPALVRIAHPKSG